MKPLAEEMRRELLQGRFPAIEKKGIASGVVLARLLRLGEGHDMILTDMREIHLTR